MDREKDHQTKEMDLENDSSKGISRRESLKRLAIGAYAVPATAFLLTAERAVAQSVPGVAREITINNLTAALLTVNYFDGSGVAASANIAAGASLTITAAVGSTLTLNGSSGAVSSTVADNPAVVINYS